MGVEWEAVIEPSLDPFWLENIERARRTPPEEKLTDGADLFDYACQVTLSGIKWQNPGVSDEGALQILRDRLAMVARREAAT